jgi:short-subunit dehydrogenase
VSEHGDRPSIGDNGSFAGTTALLTGATGGIGLAIARTLAGAGAQLILSGRRADVLEQLSRELGARTVQCDLGYREEVASLGELAVAAGVELLVSNAGLPASGELVDLSQEQADRMLEVNLRAPIALARTLAPQMIAAGRGHMVFVSSLMGKAATPAAPIYIASKFGLRGFALGLRTDLARHGVGVSVVLPGFVRDAGMFADADVRLPVGVGTCSPQDVADAAVRAVTRNRAEIAVAPVGVRLGASFASVAPTVAAAVSKRLGSERIAGEMVRAQLDKRD